MSQRNIIILFFVVAVVTAGLSSWSHADDWTRFRGPNGNGISTKAAPVEWSPTKNLKWKTELPGAGVSCPIIVDDKIIVTCYSGYGLDRREPGDQNNLKRHVVCVDRNTGKILWNQSVDPVLPEDTYSGAGVPEHGYASHTPVSDGEHIFVFFGKSGVLAFDMSGKRLWQKSVGTESDDRRWGSASSPVLHGDLVIVPAIAESSSIVAFNKTTGEQVWKQQADGLRGSWSTPIIVKIDENRSDLVIGVPGEIWGLNPDNGKLRWYCGGVPGDSFYTSVVAKDGVIYGAVGGRSGGGAFAVKTGGKGDVTESHLLWTTGDRNSYATPVVQGDKMCFASRGIVTVLNIKDGEQANQFRLESPRSSSSAGAQAESGQAPSGSRGRSGRGGRRGGFGGDYSSPVVADDKLYYIKRSGEAYVLSTGSELKQLAVNQVTEDAEEFSATPAISGGQIFIRSNKKLYCIESQN